MTNRHRAISRLVSTGAAAAVVVPPAAIFLLIWTSAVNVPFQDEWHLVPFALAARAGTMTFADIWAQANEHRMASVKLIILLLLPFSHFDVVVLMFAAFGMAVGSLVLFWRALRHTVGQVRADLVPLLMVPLSLLLFSTVQYETWLFALPALQWHVGTLGAALTVWSLARWPGSRRALVVGAGSTAVATLAVASGLALWGGTVLGVLLSDKRPERPWRVAGIGATVLALFALIYFAGFVSPSYHPSPLLALQAPLSVAKFVVAYLGAPLALHGGLPAAAIVGAAGLLASTGVAYLAVRSSGPVRGLAAPWVALWIYTVAVALITAVGRVGLGMGFALARHYAAGAALFWVAAIALTGLVWSDRALHLPRVRKQIVVGCAAVIALAMAVGYVGANRYTTRELRARQRDLAGSLQAVLQFESAPDFALQYLYPTNPTLVREYSALLKQASLGPFAKPLSSISKAPRLLPPASGAQARFLGYHQHADCQSTFGWAMDRNAPDGQVTIDVYSDDALVGTVPAMWFRSDVSATGLGTGQYGWFLATPSQWKDGKTHVIRTRFSGTSRSLSGTPKTVQCPPEASSLPR